MQYYPLFLNINNKKCVVVGGGKVAERRIKELLRCGAEVHLFSRNISRNILKYGGKIKIYKKLSPAIFKNAILVFIATDDHTFNKSIGKKLLDQDIPVNVSDAPEMCSFIVPSIVRRGDVTIAISTGGNVPALAKALRVVLNKKIGKEFSYLSSELKRVRQKVRKRLKGVEERIKIIRELRIENLIEEIWNKDEKERIKLIKKFFKNRNLKLEKL